MSDQFGPKLVGTAASLVEARERLATLEAEHAKTRSRLEWLERIIISFVSYGPSEVVTKAVEKVARDLAENDPALKGGTK